MSATDCPVLAGRSAAGESPNRRMLAGTEHSLVIGGAITHTATPLLASRVRPRSHDSRLLPRR